MMEVSRGLVGASFQLETAAGRFRSACWRPCYARPRRHALHTASRSRVELISGPHESPGDLRHPIYPTDYPICISPLFLVACGHNLRNRARFAPHRSASCERGTA